MANEKPNKRLVETSGDNTKKNNVKGNTVEEEPVKKNNVKGNTVEEEPVKGNTEEEPVEETPANENITEETNAQENTKEEKAVDRDLIVVPKKDDILFYYLKYEGDDSVDKLKLKVKVLEYPSGDSFRNVRAVVEEVIETTSSDKDEMKVGDEDIFDISDLDPKDMPIDEFVPRTVEELIAFSNSQEPEETPVNNKANKNNSKKPANEPEETPVNNKANKNNSKKPANEPEETPVNNKENKNAKEPEETPENSNKPNKEKSPAKGGSRRRRTPRKVKSSKKTTRKAK